MTPYELGNGNQTATWSECIAFFHRLAATFPRWLSFKEIGVSDGGAAIHAGVFSCDGVFDPVAIKSRNRAVLLNNNGIHPGEPEGIDACMAFVRDLCVSEAARAHLGATAFVYIPVYNVDGALNRANTSRVNQAGPEAFGFRGNARHLDLNRDFIKAASRNARAFARLFTAWDPDVMVDTHTSNGADYQHTVTLIATQPDKLGGALGAYLRDKMLPALYASMQERGWPMCPYVNPVHEIPDDGIADFLDTPRFSTGYAALHHTIGFMPETHMLKPFAERYAGTRALLGCVAGHVREAGEQIRALRALDRAAMVRGGAAPIAWARDDAQVSRFRFKGYRAVHEPSRIGRYRRLRYDREAPFEADIPYYNHFRPVAMVEMPRAYLLPQAWAEVVERLQCNAVQLTRLAHERRIDVQAWRIAEHAKDAQHFEGVHLHTQLRVEAQALRVTARAGDFIVPLGRSSDRFVFETLEPLGTDSFFRWGFFDAVLDRKEGFSDYVFEDEAERLLAAEPALRVAFEEWRQLYPEKLHESKEVLGFIYRHASRYAEAEHLRYPVFRIVDAREPLTP
jgi:hypothetical protein